MHQDTESDMLVETPFSGTYTTFHHRRLKVEDKRATVCIGIRWSVLSRFVSVSVCVGCVASVCRARRHQRRDPQTKWPDDERDVKKAVTCVPCPACVLCV